MSANGTNIETQKVYVQIKNKQGEGRNVTVGIEQLCIRTPEDLSYVKILISTADKFTPNRQDDARKNDILLIDVKGLLKLIFKYIYIEFSKIFKGISEEFLRRRKCRAFTENCLE